MTWNWSQEGLNDLETTTYQFCYLLISFLSSNPIWYLTKTVKCKNFLGSPSLRFCWSHNYSVSSFLPQWCPSIPLLWGLDFLRPSSGPGFYPVSKIWTTVVTSLLLLFFFLFLFMVFPTHRIAYFYWHCLVFQKTP